MTDLSDFARPPKKPPRAGKSTFGQTNGLHPLVERKILMIKSYYKQRNKENEKKKKKQKSGAEKLNLALERHWRLLSFSVRRVVFKISKIRIKMFLSVVRCVDALT